MPNHVTNRLNLIGEQTRIDELLDKIKNDELGRGTIDFNKIIPMPEALDVESGSVESDAIKAYLKAACPITDDYGVKKLEPEAYRSIVGKLDSKFYVKYTDQKIMETDLNVPNASELIKQGQVYVDNLLNYGATTWYDWRCNNWGTKWNAYDFRPFEDNTLTFSTAWSRALPIIDKLSEMYPDIRFSYGWADEDIGVNVGRLEMMNKEMDFLDIPDTQSKEAYEMAAEIRGERLEDYCLYYDEKTGNYEYREETEESEAPEMS